MFGIQGNGKQGVDPAKVEAIANEELQRLLKDGPTADELERAKTSFRAGFVRGIERIGGFGGKADALASCTIYTGNPGCFRATLDTIDNATAAQLVDVANKWLGGHSHTFVIEPGKRTALVGDAAVKPAPMVLPAVDKTFKTTATDVDRSTGVPSVTSFPDLKFP